MLKKLFICSMLALMACDEDATDPPLTPSLTLSTHALSVQVGATSTVTATVTNSTEAVQFISRNSGVASVTSSGTITGVAVGTTTIVGSLPSHPSIRDSVSVTVTAAGGINEPLTLPILGFGAVSERYTAEVAVAHPWAYTTTWGTRPPNPGNVVKIWNVSGNTPVLVDSIKVTAAGTLGDVQISDDGSILAVAIEQGGAQSGFAIYDRTNPSQPTLLARHVSANTLGGIHTLKLARINNRNYAFLSANPVNTSPAKIVTVDITNPAAPVEVHVRELPTTIVHDVFIRDGVLFAALWHTGMRIYDLGGAGRGGSPAAPVQLGTVKTDNCSVCGEGLSYVHNIWWFHDKTGAKRYAFIGEEGPGSVSSQRSTGGVHVVDVSNFDAPVEVAVYEPDSTTVGNGRMAGAHNFVMDEPSGILYAAFYNGGVRALDVSGDLSSCTAAQKRPDGRCDLRLMGREVGVALREGSPRYVWGVARSGTALYASDMWNGLYKIDISGLQR